MKKKKKRKENEKEKEKEKENSCNHYTDVPMLKCSVSFIINMALKPRHGI